MAWGIRGGPKELGGVGFCSFKNSIGATMAQHLLKNWRTPKEDIGETLRITMAWTQYSAGVPYIILLRTEQDSSYVKSRTILATRKYLAEFNTVIHLDTTYVQHPNHEFDVFIKHLVNTQTDCKVTTIQKENINCVRIYSGMEWISKICTNDGTCFVPGVLEGSDNCQLKYQKTLIKSNQVKPGDHSWKLWKRILKILTPFPMTTTNQLKQPFGKWLEEHSECGQWLAYQNKNGKFYAKKGP